VLKGLVLSFGGVRAVDGLDLTLRAGEVHGLIGPNGSGKTTTLNIISGYYSPEAGSLELGDGPLPSGGRRSARRGHRPHLPDAAPDRRSPRCCRT
jgi:ABC-type branched-subunit amino acid transport system ATPase component